MTQATNMSRGNIKTTLKVNDGKSIRRKILLRTCFKSWSQTTFGRVSPAKARKHYRRKLMSHCVKVWKESHLPSRIEWKLQIRAEYHERFRLWQKCLNAWKSFIILKRQTDELKKRAYQFADKKLLMKCLVSLKTNVQVKRVKRSCNEKACTFRDTRLQMKMWRHWIYAFNNAYLLKNMDYVALKHWAQTIVEKTFIRWQNVYMDKCDLKKRILYAEIYYNTKLVKRMITSWKNFIEMRREKRQEKDLADEKYQHNLLVYLFGKWRRTHQLCVHVKESEMVITALGHRAIKRRYFIHLQTYYKRKLYYQQQLISAAEIHDKQLKVIYFKRLKMVVELSKMKARSKEDAIAFDSSKLLLKYFLKWTMKCDHKEDIKLIPLSRIAYRYYRLKQITWVVYKWKQYVKVEQRQKRQYHIAEFHHNMKILPKCLLAWKQFIEIKREIDEMKNLAVEFNRELVYSKYFYTWMKHFKLCIAEASMEDIAVDHFNSIAVRTYFSYWKKCTRKCLVKHGMQEKAIQQYSHWLLLTVLKKWKLTYVDNDSSRKKMLMATLFYNKKIKRKCWNGYRKFYLKNKSRHSKELDADIFYQRKLLSKMVTSWKNYVCREKKIHARVDHICDTRNEIIGRWAFLMWKRYVKEEKQRKISVQKADAHFIFLLKCRAFRMLKQYSIRRVEKRFYEDEAVIRAGIKLEKSYLKSIFAKWRDGAKESFEEKDKLVISHNHYKRVLFTKSIAKWKQFVCHSLRMKIFHSRAVLFCIIKIESIYFQQWKVKYNCLIAENQKSNVAIWWWSFQLQRKVIKALISYTKYRHQKKKDYNHALLFRRNLLVEKGVVGWMQFASHSINRRRDIAYKEQVKRTTELQARVHKYALIWLHKTRAGKRIPKNVNPILQHTNILVNTDEVLKNVAPRITFPEVRCKKFDAKFPTAKSRPPPRLPDYLRESFELSTFKRATANNVVKSIINIKSILSLPTAANFNIDEEISPRKTNITDVCTMHSPVVHPMSRSCSDSMRFLELTDDVYSEQSKLDENEVVLLPPSTFTKVLPVD